MAVDSVVAWIELGASFAFSQRVYAAILSRRTESGRPAFSIRLRTATPMAASAFWPEKLRARRQGPRMALYRPIREDTVPGDGRHSPCPSAQSAVVRRAQRYTQQAEDGCHQPLGLTQRQVKCQAQHHARLDGKFGVDGLTARGRPTCRLPAVQ